MTLHVGNDHGGNRPLLRLKTTPSCRREESNENRFHSATLPQPVTRARGDTARQGRKNFAWDNGCPTPGVQMGV
jgi:hypothetical protein